MTSDPVIVDVPFPVVRHFRYPRVRNLVVRIRWESKRIANRVSVEVVGRGRSRVLVVPIVRSALCRRMRIVDDGIVIIVEVFFFA